MNVDRAERRHGKQVIRQDSAIGNHHHEIRFQTLERGKGGAVPHLCRLEDRQIMRQRQLLHGREGYFHTSPFRFIRLRENTHHIIMILQKGVERCGSKFRCPHKYDAHRFKTPHSEFLLP